MPTDESDLLPSLFTGIDDGERSRLVELLNTEREDSGARLTPRRLGLRGPRDVADIALSD